MSTPRDLEADIVPLLEEVEIAHGVDEADSLGGNDPEWATWHAAYLLEMGRRDLFSRTVAGDPDTLEERLKELHAALHCDDPCNDWVPFFAERLAASERDAQASGHRSGR